MIKNHWYLCPYCGQKIQKLTPRSVLINVPLWCKKCKHESMPSIKNGREQQQVIRPAT